MKKSTKPKHCKRPYKKRKTGARKGNYYVHTGDGRVLIALTQGQVGIIDAADYEKIKGRTWYAAHLKNGDKWYIFGNEYNGGNQKIVSLHDFLQRDEIEAFKIANPDCRKVVVHHINHNGLDCRRSNMEVTTNKNNLRAQRKCRPSRSIYKGVTFEKRSGVNPYKASISIEYSGNGKLYLGCFPTEMEAALAYDRAARYFFGKYAVTNFPDTTLMEILGSVSGKAKVAA